MIPIPLKKIAKISNGYLYGKNLIIESISTNSQISAINSLFVALIGNRFDAHVFAADAVDNGAKALLVNRLLPIAVPQIVVNDTCIALGKLGTWVRKQVKARVVALTGSSGKTSVKEMTASILRQCGKTLYTIGNLNNHFGVPIMLLNLTKDHDYAVIELGANHQGEIAYTTNLVHPESVLVNNLAAAHLEGFGSFCGVARAKGEIFSGLPANGTAIINAHSNDLINWKMHLNNKRVWRFSYHPVSCNSIDLNDAEFYASNVLLQTYITKFTLHTPFGNITIQLPLPGQHNVTNALAAAALSMSVNAPLNAVREGLSTLQPIPGRLFPIHLTDNQLLIDDTYNANIDSMTVAINVLCKMPGFRVLVVGDMKELGDQSEEYHLNLGKVVKSADIDRVLTIGTFSYLISRNNKKCNHFNDRKDLIEHLYMLISKYQHITILIKGSHSANMDKIVQILKEKKHVGLAS